MLCKHLPILCIRFIQFCTPFCIPFYIFTKIINRQNIDLTIHYVKSLKFHQPSLALIQLILTIHSVELLSHLFARINLFSSPETLNPLSNIIIRFVKDLIIHLPIFLYNIGFFMMIAFP